MQAYYLELLQHYQKISRLSFMVDLGQKGYAMRAFFFYPKRNEFVRKSKKLTYFIFQKCISSSFCVIQQFFSSHTFYCSTLVLSENQQVKFYGRFGKKGERKFPFFILINLVTKKAEIFQSSPFLILFILNYFAAAKRFATSVQLITLKNASI